MERTAIAPGYSIPRMILGGWQLSQGHTADPPDRPAVIEALLRMLESGFDTFDCGDIYSGVEELLGEVGSRYRASAAAATRPMQVHTKFVPDLDALPTLNRAYVETVVDRSLRRLRVERLDLVQFAWWDYRVPRYVETALWLTEMVRAGKVRLLGATNFDTPRLRELLDAGVPIVTHQVQYSVLDRRPEHGMVELCRAQGIALLCFGTLAGGFLSHRYAGVPEPASPLANRSLTKYHLVIREFGGWDRFQELLAELRRVADRHGVDVANVAVRWVLDQPQVAAAIVGARHAGHLAANRATFGLVLDPGDQEIIERASSRRAGPTGDVYDLERVPGGPHAIIMRYNLNQVDAS